jgi:hypothetical protein
VTIAVSLKVNDGLVLAADSASTIASSSGVVNVYDNANKVFNLRKGLPVGLITWGLGGLGGLSISTLAKDLRERFAGDDPDHENWHLDPQSYTVEEVAARVKDFFYGEHYAPAAAAYEPGDENDAGYPPLGFIVAGYSSGGQRGEEYLLDLTAEGCAGPQSCEPRTTRASRGRDSQRPSHASSMATASRSRKFSMRSSDSRSPTYRRRSRSSKRAWGRRS